MQECKYPQANQLEYVHSTVDARDMVLLRSERYYSLQNSLRAHLILQPRKAALVFQESQVSPTAKLNPANLYKGSTFAVPVYQNQFLHQLNLLKIYKRFFEEKLLSSLSSYSFEHILQMDNSY